ncbi:hypothetical protein RB213_010293 [Colletotrichum asianum]
MESKMSRKSWRSQRVRPELSMRRSTSGMRMCGWCKRESVSAGGRVVDGAHVDFHVCLVLFVCKPQPRDTVVWAVR